MCFRTDGIVYTWRGRVAWRTWRLGGRPQGKLYPPHWGENGRPIPPGPIQLSDREPAVVQTAFGIYRVSHGLYAYTKSSLAVPWGSGVKAKVYCYGEGYLQRQGLVLTCESLVIGALYVQAGTPRPAQDCLSDRYQVPVIEVK